MNSDHQPATPPSFFDKLNQFIRDSISVKLASIGLLILILLIPIGMIDSLISERSYRQQDAINEISQSWANAQTIGGPIINIPYTTFLNDGKSTVQGTLHLMPTDYEIETVVTPEIRYRGIYEVPVYTSQSDVSFSFDPSIIKIYSNRTYQWDQMSLSFGLSDPRGLTDKTQLTIGDAQIEFEPGIHNSDVFNNGISTPLELGWNDTVRNKISCSTKLNLRGTGSVNFIPTGKSTSVNIESTWANPSFNGSYLPNSRDISKDGFTADWSVLNYTRNVPQVFEGNQNLESSSFGVSLFSPVNHYQKTERSIKYAVMLIALTFMLFFFSQAINKVNIHPFQYLLVGLALCMFYTLLLSISEHVGFNMAYVVAASMILIMITLYIRKIFHSTRFTLITSGVLAGLYIFIFTILQMQDFALLIGSIGLFIILAALMWLSLKLDWNPKQ